MGRGLVILPDDGAAPLVDAIRGATSSLRLKMFVLTHEKLIGELIAAHGRGLMVRVMLNPARRNGKEDNVASRYALVAAGVAVQDSSPAFELTHEKSLVVDGTAAYVMSLNWEKRNLRKTRDFAVATTERDEVDEIAACFDADWARVPFAPPVSSALVWCNRNARERFARFVDAATSTLWLQNERYQDPVVVERIVRAANRGVDVRALARRPHALKEAKLVEGLAGLRAMQDAGAKVHRMKGLKLHGKVMIADGARAIVGSVNLTPGSFDARRDLAIEVDDPAVVAPLAKIAEQDWSDSLSLDLSDRAVLADLARHGQLSRVARVALDLALRRTRRRPPQGA
ncbi:MAG: phospholipase D-like domain-containing protein [Vicinamibacteria bacterium]|jgi:phosphatidylserine/phosphatidylglycerophosphate/cardiolipin synthase-like enzyme